MEEKLSDWLFNFGADNEIVMMAELLEREHDKFQEALNRIAHETHTRTYLVDIAKEALNAVHGGCEISTQLDQYRELLSTLKSQAVNSIEPGWVMIPSAEWKQVWERFNRFV